MDKRLKNRQFGYLTPGNAGVVINMQNHQQLSGYSVGIIYIENVCYPWYPGNVVNAYTYDFPVRMKAVPNLNFDRLVSGDPKLAEEIIQVGKHID